MKTITLFLFCMSLYAGNIIAQFTWQHTDGPFGAALSPIYSNDNYAFIPKNDFLYRTDDGITWEKIEHPVSIFMYAYKDTLVNILYNEDGDSLRFQISYDNGINWIQKELPDEFNLGLDIVMTIHGIYLSQRSDDLTFRSTDLGETWNIVPVPQEFHTMEVHENRLYTYSTSSLWRTDTSGNNWENVTPPLPAFSYVGDIVAKDSHLLVSSEELFFHSHDHGQSWESINISAGNANNSLTLVGDKVYFSAKELLLRSDDFGVTWDTLVLDVHPFYMVSAVGLNDVYLFTTVNKGVFRWDNSEQVIVESNDGFSKGLVYDLAVGDDKIWAACGNGVFAYDIPSETWSEKMNLPIPDFEYDFISANDHGWVLVSEVLGEEFYLSENNGLDWHTIPLPAFPGIYFIDKMHLIGDIIYLVSDYFLFRSEDKGLSWDFLDVDFIDTEIVTANGILYMASVDSLYSSVDNGVTWNVLHLPIEIRQLFEFSGILYALVYNNQAYDMELYISTDGVQWEYASDGFPKDYSLHPTYGVINAIFFRDAINHYGFLGWQGHYAAPVASMQWSGLSTSQEGNCYVIHDNVIYLGSQGVYKSLIENPYITSVEEVFETTNAPFTISPNPAQELITITFDNTFHFQNPIQIHSFDGKLVKAIDSFTEDQQTNITILDLPAGMYTVSITGESGKAAKSFVKM